MICRRANDYNLMYHAIKANDILRPWAAVQLCFHLNKRKSPAPNCLDNNLLATKAASKSGYIFVQVSRGCLGKLCRLEICFYSRLDKCQRHSQMFPVSLAYFASSGVLVSFIPFIFPGKCPFWHWEGFLRGWWRQKGHVSSRMKPKID